MINDFLPFLESVTSHHWRDIRTDTVLDYFEVMQRYGDRLPYAVEGRGTTGSPESPQWLQQYTSLLKVCLIQTQRLLRVDSARGDSDSGSGVRDVIDLYSEEIKKAISSKLAESAAESQLKDRSFPDRLLSMKLDDSLSEVAIRDQYADTEKRIQRLMIAGLIDQEKNISLPDKSLEETERKVLALYLQDINQKLGIYDGLLRKIEVFLGIVGRKLNNKEFKVDRRDGFKITPIRGEAKALKPSQLSSGEQHQIVLFYELIFRSEGSSLFLIDEPEISLHVDWQRQFYSDVRSIADLGGREFLIATHSPQIIGEFRELAVALDEGVLE